MRCYLRTSITSTRNAVSHELTTQSRASCQGDTHNIVASKHVKYCNLLMQDVAHLMLRDKFTTPTDLLA